MYIGRAFFSAIILLYLLYKVDLDSLKRGITSLKFVYIYLSLLPLFLEMVLKSLKWQMLLKVKNFFIAFSKIFKIYYVSSFLGMFLPSSLGIDVLRSYSLAKEIKNTHHSISTVFIDRILGILSLIFVVTLGVFAIKTKFTVNAVKIIILIFVCLIAVLAMLLVFEQLLNILERLLGRLKLGRFRIDKLIHALREIHASIVDFKRNKWAIFQVFLVSVLFQINRIAITYIVALALDVNIDFAYWVVIVPLVTLATMLPFAIGGLGIREGAFIFFLGQLGVSISTSFLLSFVIFMLGIITLLPGLVMYLRGGMLSNKLASAPQ